LELLILDTITKHDVAVDQELPGRCNLCFRAASTAADGCEAHTDESGQAWTIWISCLMKHPETPETVETLKHLKQLVRWYKSGTLVQIWYGGTNWPLGTLVQWYALTFRTFELHT